MNRQIYMWLFDVTISLLMKHLDTNKDGSISKVELNRIYKLIEEKIEDLNTKRIKG